jgi:hypothetical protein
MTSGLNKAHNIIGALLHLALAVGIWVFNLGE